MRNLKASKGSDWRLGILTWILSVSFGGLGFGYDPRAGDMVPLSKPEQPRYGWRAFGPDVAESGKAGDGELWIHARWRLGTYGVGNAFLGPLDFVKYSKLVFEARSTANKIKLWVDLNRLVVDSAPSKEKLGSTSVNLEGKQAQVQTIATTAQRKIAEVSNDWKEFSFKFPEDFELYSEVGVSDGAQVDEITIVLGNPGTEDQDMVSIRNIRLVK